MAKAWWRKHAVRLYHPNAREFELRDLDVKRFIAACVLTEAEAIVVSAGGIYAFYPSQVPYHYVSPVIGARDLFGEIVAEARVQGLRVLARVDFSKAREDVWQAHPEWFARQADGAVVRAGDYYVTCPMAGYQNEDFALPVLRELAQRYAVDGVHLNAAGFHGFCWCEACATAYGRPLPQEGEPDPEAWQRFLRWRQAMFGRQMATYYETLFGLNPEVYFIAELAGPDNPAWAYRNAQHLPSLSHAFSQLLLTTGGVGGARSARGWAGLAAEQARAVRRKRNPVINLKMQMRDLDLPQMLMPPGEFAFQAYQALAHGAGLKVPTFGLPEEQPDPRALPALGEVFGLMRQQQVVLDSMEPIQPVALVWPEQALAQSGPSTETTTGGLRGEALGLYEALRARHVQVGLLYDEQLADKGLSRYEALVLPTAVWLDELQTQALAAYVVGGGRLVLLDSPATWPGRSPAGSARRLDVPPLPAALAELLGGRATQEIGNGNYALPAGPVVPKALRELGPLALTQPYRRVEPGERAEVWLCSARSQRMGVPEDLDAPEPGDDPLALFMPVEQGCIVYWATGLGQMALGLGHPDYATLLETMLSHAALLKPPLLTDAPSAVEVTLARWKQGVVVHLVNGAGPAPLDAPATVGPITLSLAWDGPALAELCVPGASPRRLRCEEEWNRVRIVVPSLGSYAQVVVRSA